MREIIATHATTDSNRVTVRASETLTGARTLTTKEIDRWQVIVFAGGASDRVVTLPAEGRSNGAFLFLVNAGATNALTVNEDGATLIKSIPAAKAALFVCDGTVWRSMLGA